MPQELPHLQDFPKKSISISNLYNQIHKLYPAWDLQRWARVTEAHFGKFKGVGGMKAHSLQLMGYLEKPPRRLISGSRETGGFGGLKKSYANGAEEE